MDNVKTLNHNFATIGWGLLLLWWGVSFMIGPITIGMSAIGTGLILLGINAARALRGIPTNRSTTGWGLVALLWGLLDTTLSLSLERSLAALLMVVGAVTIVSLLVRPQKG